MSDNPLLDAFPLAGQNPRAVVAEALARLCFLPVTSLDQVRNMDMATAGTPYGGLVWNGQFYRYDPDDLTSSDDGVTIIVSDDDRRYKATQQVLYDRSVISLGDETPPADPAFNDAYVLGAAPTGDWAGYGKNIAVRVEERWLFLAPFAGMNLYVEDEDAFYHYSASAAWTQGFGDLALADGSIGVEKLKSPFGFNVEAEQADPPGSVPAADTAYIVGVSATGAWLGEDTKIAISNGTGYAFHAPTEGSFVNDKGAGFIKTFSEGVWVAAAGHVVQAIPVNIHGEDTALNLPGSLEHIRRTVPIKARTGDVIVFMLTDLRIGLKGYGNGEDSGTYAKIFAKRDDEVAYLYQAPITDVSSASTWIYPAAWNSVDDLALPGSFIQIADDDEEHDFNFGFIVKWVSGTYGAKIDISGIAFVIRNSVQE